MRLGNSSAQKPARRLPLTSPFQAVMLQREHARHKHTRRGGRRATAGTNSANVAEAYRARSAALYSRPPICRQLLSPATLFRAATERQA